MAAPSAWTVTYAGRRKLLDGTLNVEGDTYKCGLATNASNLGTGSTTYAALTGEVSNANGYTTGGITVDLTLSAAAATITADVATDPVWTASAAGITARYAFIYEVGGDILAYCLLDSAPADVTATAGNTLTVAAHATNGIFTFTQT